MKIDTSKWPVANLFRTLAVAVWGFAAFGSILTKHIGGDDSKTDAMLAGLAIWCFSYVWSDWTRTPPTGAA